MHRLGQDQSLPPGPLRPLDPTLGKQHKHLRAAAVQQLGGTLDSHRGTVFLRGQHGAAKLSSYAIENGAHESLTD